MTLPPLPEPADYIRIHGNVFTEAQMLAFQAATVEACAKVVDDEILNWDQDKLLTAIAGYIRSLLYAPKQEKPE
jgi:uncharacterized membrane-anchored protein